MRHSSLAPRCGARKRIAAPSAVGRRPDPSPIVTSLFIDEAGMTSWRDERSRPPVGSEPSAGKSQISFRYA